MSLASAERTILPTFRKLAEDSDRRYGLGLVSSPFAVGEARYINETGHVEIALFATQT